MKNLSLIHFSTKNLRRHFFRTLAISVCLGLVTATLFSETLLTEGVGRSLEVGVGRLGADILVIPEGLEAPAQESLLMGSPITFYMESSKEQEVAAIPGVEYTTSQLFLASLTAASCCSGSFQLIGFDPDTDFVVNPWLKEALNRPLEKDEVVVGRLIFQLPGEEMLFYGHQFNVVGKMAPTGTGFDKVVFMSIEDAYVMAKESWDKAEQPLILEPNTISAVLVRIEPGVSTSMVAERIKNSVDGVSVLSSSQFIRSVERHLSGIVEGMLFVTGTFWVVSILLIGGVFSMAVNERRREIGLLRAIGATGSFIFRMILSEALLVALLGGVLGVIGGGVAMYGFSVLISRSLEVPYLWPTLNQIVGMAGISLGLAVLTGLLASLFPALASSRMEPLNAIRSRE